MRASVVGRQEKPETIVTSLHLDLLIFETYQAVAVTYGVTVGGSKNLPMRCSQ